MTQVYSHLAASELHGAVNKISEQDIAADQVAPEDSKTTASDNVASNQVDPNGDDECGCKT